MGANPKSRKVAVYRHRRRPYRSIPLQRLLLIVMDKIERKKYTVKSFKEFRNHLKAVVNDNKFWSGLEDIEKAVKKLGVDIDSLG